MSATGAGHVLVELQLVAAGLCLALALAPGRRGDLDRRWLTAWQVVAASVLVTNYLLFVSDGTLFDAALFLRAALLGVVAVLVLGVVRSFTGRRAPAWIWGVALATLGSRLFLWPTTDLFYERRLEDGAPGYGPLLVVTSVPVLLAVGIFVVHALATGARREERATLAVGFGLEGVLLGLSLLLEPPAAELVVGYQSVPAVVALQVLSVRRTRAMEAAVRSQGRQRVRLAELARDLQGADDLASAARMAAEASVEMLEADDVVVTLGSTSARAGPPFAAGPAARNLEARSGLVDVVAAREPVTVRVWRRRAFDEVDHRLLDTVGDVVGASVERIRAEDQLRHRALHDDLTGLANRTLLVERLGAALVRAGRTRLPVTVLFADLDGFKDVNDEHGHPMGDALLRRVAQGLRQVVREGDTVARFGGDEFVVLCEGLDVDGLPDVAERVLAALNGEQLLDGRTVQVRGSIGVAVGHHGDDPHALLRDADTAMYRAKHLGGGRLEVFDASLRAMLLDRIELERGIPQAVARHELVLRYQPIHRLSDGRPSHVEALSRWVRHGRVTPPDVWIPAAEHTGAIDDIGAWVLREACRRLAAERTAGGLGVAVNVSPHQLRRDQGLEKLRAAISQVPLDPTRIWLEVTESAITDAAGLAALEALRGLGVRVALDDFGTGYSSLSTLSRLPVDVIKIDRAFVHRLADPDGRAVVRAVVRLVQDLGRAVVAEGIETEEQLRIAEDLGCTYGQGFYLGRPVDAMPVAEPA